MLIILETEKQGLLSLNLIIMQLTIIHSIVHDCLFVHGKITGQSGRTRNYICLERIKNLRWPLQGFLMAIDRYMLYLNIYA